MLSLVRTSEIKTLKGVVNKAHRRCFILQNKVEDERKAREEVEKDNKDLKLVLQSMRRRSSSSTFFFPSGESNSKDTLASSYRFLQKKYQERLGELERVEEELEKLKEHHCQCSHSKKAPEESKQRKPFFRIS